MPGTLAQWYQELGGDAVLMGKPSPIIYEAAAAMAPNVHAGRWLAIGDSLQHDIAGAAAAGTGPGLFIVGGIHAEEAGLRGGPEAGNAGSGWNAGALARLCREHGAAPKWAAAWMQW
jgi:ribonucleotide monophosphatase NagD (HAD superfamily)